MLSPFRVIKKMDEYLRSIDNDDDDFIRAVDCWLYAMIQSRTPSDLFVVRVDNWFDHKWLGFAGQSKVHIDTGLSAIDSEIQAHWRTGADVTIPPFAPKRIIEQSHFKRKNDILVQQNSTNELVHSLHQKRSSENLHNRAIGLSSHGLFIWLSSKSALSQRASMMLYRTTDDKLKGWYSSFVKRDEWKVDKTKNMDRELFSRLFSNAVNAMSPKKINK